MPDLTRTTPAWSGAPLMDDRGERFATLGDLLTDPAGGARWQLVDLGGRLTAVPARHLGEGGGEIAVPYPRRTIESAPQVDPDALDEDALASHFGVTETSDEAVEVVRSEEEVRIDTTTVAHARVRVRKEVVTEDVDLRLTVRREVLHVEHAPQEVPEMLAPGEVTAYAVEHEFADDVREVVLHTEVPVVDLVVVPRERVRFSRTVVTEPVTVVEPRRVEHVDVERLPAEPGP